MTLRLAITQRIVTDERTGEARDSLDRNWYAFIEECFPGCLVFPIPNNANLAEAWLASVSPEGVVFSGGNDWGEAPERDRTEETAFTWCRKQQLPILGVCRGFQVLNVLLGGKLEMSVAALSSKPHVGVRHELTLHDAFPGLRGLRHIEVNSYHNQGVSAGGLAAGLDVFATAEDSIIEGFVHARERIIGIQWHPEREKPFASTDIAIFRGMFMSPQTKRAG